MVLSVISLNFVGKITLFSPFLVVWDNGGLTRQGMFWGGFTKVQKKAYWGSSSSPRIHAWGDVTTFLTGPCVSRSTP